MFSRARSGITTVQHAENLCICNARYDRKLLLRFLDIEIRLPSSEVIEKVNVEKLVKLSARKSSNFLIYMSSYAVNYYYTLEEIFYLWKFE